MDRPNPGVDAAPILRRVVAHASDRKARLFACAYARLVSWDGLAEHIPAVADAVEVAERFADGEADADELKRANDAAYEDAVKDDGPEVGAPQLDAVAASAGDPREFARLMLMQAEEYYDLRLVGDPGLDSPSHREWEAWAVRWHAGVVRAAREVFGDPDRPASFDPAWRTTEVVALARGIDRDRDFARMPDLARALLAAGCDHADVLGHCEPAEGHARGCWVVDEVLERA